MVKIRYYLDNLTEGNICTPQAIYNPDTRILAYSKIGEFGFTRIFGVRLLEIEDDFR